MLISSHTAWITHLQYPLPASFFLPWAEYRHSQYLSQIEEIAADSATSVLCL